LTCSFRTVITAISDRRGAAQAAVSASGWPSCSLRSAVRIAVALSGVLRRRARLSAALTRARAGAGGPRP
jgi:hypothetical protein